MSKKLTPWFPNETKPATKGVYQRKGVNDVARNFYSYWDGIWHGHWKTVNKAVAMRHARFVLPVSSEWRGLAKKPATKDAEVSNG